MRLKLGPPAVLSAVIRQVIDDYGPTIDGPRARCSRSEAQVFADTRHRRSSGCTAAPAVRELLVAADSLYEPLSRLVRTKEELSARRSSTNLNESVELLNRASYARGHCPPAYQRTRRQPHPGLPAAERGHAPYQRVGCHRCSTNALGRHLRHELRSHARAALEVGLSICIALMLTVALVLHRAFKRSEWL